MFHMLKSGILVAWIMQSLFEAFGLLDLHLPKLDKTELHLENT